MDKINLKYNDPLGTKLDRILSLATENRISSLLAKRLISFYLKKELKKEIRNELNYINQPPKKRKEILLAYYSKKTEYFNI